MNLNEHIMVNGAEFQDDEIYKFSNSSYFCTLFPGGSPSVKRSDFPIQFPARQRKVKNKFYGQILMIIKQ